MAPDSVALTGKVTASSLPAKFTRSFSLCHGFPLVCSSGQLCVSDCYSLNCATSEKDFDLFIIQMMVNHWDGNDGKAAFSSAANYFSYERAIELQSS